MVSLENVTAWYPMRVTYNRELRIKDLLDALHIENFLPMKKILVDTVEGYPRWELKPAINNLIFVRSTRNILTELKTTKREFSPMRYMRCAPSVINPAVGGRLLTVSDREMENFMRVASVQDDSITYLENTDYINQVGKKVRVLGGPFEGLEGVIKRIKKNRLFVVQIKGIVAVAVTTIPHYLLEEIKEKQTDAT